MYSRRFSERWIDNLLNHIDIVQVVTDTGLELKERNVKGEFVASCPFHSEKTPSFTVTSRKQFCHCFGCGAGGNAIEFLMCYNNWSFKRSVVYLAKLVGFPLYKTVKKRRKRHGRNKNWKPKPMPMI
jgi:DNA primase